MNILFVSIAWPETRERNLYSDLMSEFIIKGHKVYVVSATDKAVKNNQMPVHENGMIVLRINSGKIRKTSHFKKSYSLLTLGGKISEAISEYYKDIKFDLLLSHTPPITLSSLFKKLKRINQAPFYLLLKDIWPQGSVDHKVFRKYGVAWFYLRMHEKRIYRTADFIGCMSPLGVTYLLSKNRFLTSRKVEVCPNSIRPTIKFEVLDHQSIRLKYGIPSDACVFIFSGNLSKGHGLDFLVEATRYLIDYNPAFFLIGGSGTHFQHLETEYKKTPSKNVLLYKRLPAGDFEQIMQTSDVGLILLDKCYTVPQFPSRLLTYLDHSKPVLCAVNEGTDIGSIIEDNNCGKSLIHGDMDSFIKAIRYFCENPGKRIEMGFNAHELLGKSFTVEKGYKIIANHFRDLISQ